MIISIISLLICLSRAGEIRAIQEAYPFQIDYILYALDGEFWNNSPSGVNQINFVAALPTIPNNAVISMNSYTPATFSLGLKFSFIIQNLTRTGFQLKVQISSVMFRSLSLSYMIIKNNFGAQIQHINMQSLSRIGTTQTYYKNILTSLINNPTNTTDYHISSYIEIIDVSQIITGTSFTTQWSFLSSQTFNFSVTFSYSNTILNNITFGVLIMNYTLINTLTADFHGYSFKGYIQAALSPTGTSVKSCTNTSCGLLFMVGATKLTFSASFLFTFNSFDRTTIGTFNSDFVRARSSSLNLLTAKGTSGTYNFNYVGLERLQCSGQYKYIMVINQTCFSECPPKYYPGIGSSNLNKCLLCSSCSSIVQCPGCLTSICSSNEYLNVATFPGTISCILCSTIDSNCEKCINGTCTKCFSSSQRILKNGSCIQCLQSTYFYNDTCKKCPSRCQTCKNESYCTNCSTSFVLQNNKCIIALITYTTGLSKIKGYSNIIQLSLNFNGNISQVMEYYNTSVSINDQKFNIEDNNDNQKYIISYYIIEDTNNLRINIQYLQSLTQPLFTIYLENKTTQKFLKRLQTNDSTNPDDTENQTIQYQLQNTYHSSQQDKKQMTAISETMQFLGNNAGTMIGSSFLITKGTEALLKMLWTIQLSSIYQFLNINIPQKVNDILLSMQYILQSQLLPIDIPQLPIDQGVKVKLQPKYQQAIEDVDGYFIRETLDNFFQIGIFCIIFTIIYYLGLQIKPQNIYLKFVRNKLTHKLYSNIAMAFYSALINISFNASLAVTSRSFQNTILLGNYTTSAIGLLFTFAFCGIHCILLKIFKRRKNMDNKECYFGLLRSRSKSQVCLFLFILNQIAIPPLIMLCDYNFSLIMIIFLKFIYIVCVVRYNCIQKKFLLLFRIVGFLGDLIFNLCFLFFALIQHRYPKTQAYIIQRIETACLYSLYISVLSEFAQTFIDLITDIYEFFQRKCKRKLTNQDNQNIQEAIQQTLKQQSKFSKSEVDSEIEQYNIQAKPQQSEMCLNNSDNSNVSPPLEPDIIFSRQIQTNKQNNNMSKSMAETKDQTTQIYNNNISKFSGVDVGNRQIKRALTIKRTLKHKHLSQMKLNQLFSIQPRCLKSSLIFNPYQIQKARQLQKQKQKQQKEELNNISDHQNFEQQ